MIFSDVIELDSLLDSVLKVNSLIEGVPKFLNIGSLMISKVLQVESIIYTDEWTSERGSEQNETF